MKTKFTVLLLAFGFYFAPVAVLADPQALASNQLLEAQFADAITTRALLQRPQDYERNPLARPFVANNLKSLGGVLAANLVARILFRHAPIVTRLLTGVEAICVGNNVRVLEK